MKKRTLLILCGILSVFICLFSLTACGRVEFKINFIVDGEVYSTVKTSGSEVIKLPDNPTKEGYTFDGWYWDEDAWQKPFTANSILDAPLSSDMKVYCKWKSDSEIDEDKGSETTQPENYSIKFVYGNGQADKIITQGFGTYIESIESPTREGYIFDGWDKAIPSVMPAENIVITAQWVAVFTQDGGKITGLTAHGKTLTEITIPSEIDNVSIIEIGRSAFSSCKSLTSVTIGSGVTSIGDWAFNICSSLTSIVISDSVMSIGYSAFGGCYNLNKVNYTGTIDEWAQISFTMYKSSVFDYSSNPIYHVNNLYINDVLLTEAKITTATKINDYAFFNCESLTSVTIGSGVTSIGERAFEGCTSLTSITIPNSVTSIGNDAFYLCTSLKYNIHNNAKYLGNNNNPYLVLVKVTDKSMTFYEVNENCKFIHGRAFEGCTELTTITIPNSVTSIGNAAFYYCTSLTDVTIGSGVKFIGASAFYYCTSLTSVVIPDSVTEIAGMAFANCTSLTDVIIGSGVTNIHGNSVFANCASLTSVEFKDNANWYITDSHSNCLLKEWGTEISVINSSTNATYFKSTYIDYCWYKK